MVRKEGKDGRRDIQTDSRNASNNAPMRGVKGRKKRKKRKKKKMGGVKREEERMSRSTNCQLFLLVAHANAFLSSRPHACVLCVRINLNTNERTMKKNDGAGGGGVW